MDSVKDLELGVDNPSRDPNEEIADGPDCTSTDLPMDSELGPDQPPVSTEETLPSYDQVQQYAPLSYQSVYDQIKDAKAESSGVVEFFGQFILIMLGTVCFTILLAVIMSIPITMIVIGSIYKDECPAEEYIPIYLIVGGAFALVQNLVILSVHVNSRRMLKELREEDLDISMTQVVCAAVGPFCYIVVGLFLFAWFIAGNVWIYGTDVDTENKNAANYCDGTLYYFAFWLTNTTYMMIALSMLL